mmetsp:Transcript_76599/g.222447  ORF Transcript_76599/g.222447 Transcript_76599/m.222447 type:complete len:113 (-) Transcript_76599:102-440(-)
MADCEVSVFRALSGALVCKCPIGPETTMMDLRRQIESLACIPAHTQRLLVDGRAVLQRSALVADVLSGRAPEIQLVCLSYSRQEKQAAGLIEVLWKRSRREPEPQVPGVAAA